MQVDLRITFLLIQLFWFSNCHAREANEQKTKNTKTLISERINKIVPPPPPPPIGEKVDEFPQEVYDSLAKLPLKIAVYPIMEAIIYERLSDRVPEQYKLLIEKGSKENEKIRIQEISNQKGHEIFLADTLRLKESKEYEDFDFLIHFSQIYYNKKFTKAVFEYGLSRSALAGSAAIYCLRKENGKWLIDDVIETEVW